MRAGMWDEQLEMLLRALWKYGVMQIQDENLRSTVIKFLCVVPRIFYVDHASRSGNFHPWWQNGQNGTLRSIVESVILLPPQSRHIRGLLNEALEPNQHAMDVAYAATIISDTWKKEDHGDIHYGPEHGRIAAEHWRSFAHIKHLDAHVIEEVADACYWHMGLYTPGATLTTPFTPVTELVNACDVCTSHCELGVIYEPKLVIV